MKRIFWVLVILALSVSVGAMDLNTHVLQDAGWCIYFAAIEGVGLLKPSVEDPEAVVFFFETTFLFSAPGDEKTYSYQLDPKAQTITVYQENDLGGKVLWIWYYEHPYREMLIMTAWCPICEVAGDRILTILVRRIY